MGTVKNEKPAIPVATAKAVLIPVMYANKIPLIGSGEDTWRNSAALVAMSVSGFTEGAEGANVKITLFTKPPWAPERLKLPLRI